MSVERDGAAAGDVGCRKEVDLDGIRALEGRDVRALTQYMTVLDEGGDIYSVTSQSGNEYRVDYRTGKCTCRDHQMRRARCKHIRRVAFALGDRVVPTGVDRAVVDPDLGRHV